MILQFFLFKGHVFVIFLIIITMLLFILIWYTLILISLLKCLRGENIYIIVLI